MKKWLIIVLTSLLLLILLVVLVVALGLMVWTRADSPPASQAFIDGQVLTMDADNRITEALFIAQDRIVFAGTTDEVLARSDDQTIVHQLDGRTLIPGFIDAHGHFPGSGAFEVAANLNAPPIAGVTSIAQLQSSFTDLLKGKKQGEWLFGMGYDDTLLTEGRHPTRDDLDAVSRDHPIYAMHVSGHMGVANSKALELLEINDNTPSPPGGIIVKDSAGRVTGLLKENATFKAMKQATDFSVFDVWKIIQAASREYASQGVTTVQNGAADKRMVIGLQWVTRFNLIPQRVEIWPLHTTLSHAELEKRRADNNDQTRLGAIKIVADGSIQGYTGYLSQPYHVPPRGESRDFKGHTNQSVVELNKWVNELHQRGWQLAVHGNGDGAIDQILDAVEAAQKAHPISDPRHVLIHAQMARQDQLERMRDLGVTPSFFSAHTYYWGDRHRDIFMGPDRAAFMSPAKASQELGLRYTIHLDSPVVPMQPLRLIWSAVNRLSSSGEVIGPDQRISPMMALRATTIEAAWQTFKEDQIGSLESGKLADLIILNDDPLTNPTAIADIKVDATYVGGRQIYQRIQ